MNIRRFGRAAIPLTLTLTLTLTLGLVVGRAAVPTLAASPEADVPPIVGSWQIAALSADGFEFYIQYTFTSDGIVWVFVPDGRHGSGAWEESESGEVTMSFVIQSGTEEVPYVERIWERFLMPEPGASTWAAEFAYYSEDIEGIVIEGGPSGSVVARRFDVRPDLGQPVTAPPAASPGPSAAPIAPTASPDVGPSTALTIATSADTPGHFDRALLRAPAGSEVTVRYDNDSAHLHNIAFFAGDSTEDELIARTEVEPGPRVQEVTFVTPDEPGTFRYVCQVHPLSMTGILETS